MTNLTNKESTMLAAFIAEGMEVAGGTCAEDVKADNMTWMSSADLVSELNWGQKSTQGVMASLEKKGLIVNSGESARDARDTDWFASDAGIDLHFAQEAPAEVTVASLDPKTYAGVEAKRQEFIATAITAGWGRSKARRTWRAVHGSKYK